ncbi:MAG: CPBP family intramembrane metalloprotease [Oscillospiraceae bacterium]|nr:CPBP family intramembrane metalloprotease [Oscillospiraceae bacterium]
MGNIKKKSFISRLISGKTAVLTCLIITIVFLLVLHLCAFVTDKLIPASSAMLRKTVCEGLLAVFALFLLKITAGFRRLRSGVLAQLRQLSRGRKIRILIMFSCAVVIHLFRAVYGHTSAELRPVGDILLFVLFVTFIGIAEEVVFRGVIAESMLRTFGTDEEGKHFAALVSGIIFGMAHIQNMFDSEVLGVLVQCVGASVIGILFTELYYSLHSLKPTIILHAGIDFLAALEFGLFEDVSASQIVSTYSLWMVVPYAVLFLAWLGYSKLFGSEKLCTEG